MSPVALVLLPLLAAPVLALLPSARIAARANVAASAATLAAAVALLAGPAPEPSAWLRLDALAGLFVLLTCFVGFTTSLYSAGYLGHELAAGRITEGGARIYHAMYQAMVGTMLLAFLAENMGLMWVAIEVATLATVLMVGLYRTPAALEAAWKYFILGSVGIALALFGTILVYVAAQPAMGEGLAAMQFGPLLAHAAEFDPAMLDVAFVFLLLGYGTKAGLVPLHAWLPDAHAEGPTPISAVLSGLLLNVALHAVLRFKLLLGASPGAMAVGPLLVLMGLGSVLFAALMLYRRRDLKRLFAYSSIEHMGIAVFAFGLGGPMASFAGLLHALMHGLTKPAIFFAVGQASQAAGSQQVGAIRGLTVSHPVLGWGLVAGVLAIGGAPPSGIFMSEFMAIGATLGSHPWLALPLAAGLLAAFGALVRQLSQVAFGVPLLPATPVSGSTVPMQIHLGLVLVGGVWLPPPLAAWLAEAAGQLG